MIKTLKVEVDELKQQKTPLGSNHVIQEQETSRKEISPGIFPGFSDQFGWVSEPRIPVQEWNMYIRRHVHNIFFTLKSQAL